MNSWEEWLKYAPKPRPLSGDEKYNVFLSYRSVNRTWVINLYDVLRQQGFEVFLDQYTLLAGTSLNITLGEALEASQAGVLVWSDATRHSEWVKSEYDLMLNLARANRNFKFVPVKLDKSEMPKGFLANPLYLDFSSYPDGPNGGELLKLLYALVGETPSDDAVKFASRQDEAAMLDFAKIDAAIANGQAARIQQLFREGGLAWETSSALGCKAAEGLTRLDRNEEAIGMLKEMEARFPKAIRPKQLHALALARRAANHPGITEQEREENLDQAREIIGTLYHAGERDPETTGIFARTWFDLYKKTGNINHLRNSRRLYAEAFEAAQDDYYTGINAASKSILIGSPRDLEIAAGYADRVRRVVGEKAHPNNYWKTATVAETFLIQKNYRKAAELYQAAVEMSPEEIGSHKSTWGQASLLMEKLLPTDEERRLIADAFAYLEE